MSNDYSKLFISSIEHFKGQLATLRTNRATPSLVEQLSVECYGGRLPLVQIASISAPEPRQILIQPWDATIIKEIEKAINASPLGLQPTIDGQIIRLNLPVLTEDRRKDLIKILHQYEESARVAIKKIREETLKDWKEAQRRGEMSEDALSREEKELQKEIEECHADIKVLADDKSKEILTI